MASAKTTSRKGGSTAALRATLQAIGVLLFIAAIVAAACSGSSGAAIGPWVIAVLGGVCFPTDGWLGRAPPADLQIPGTTDLHRASFLQAHDSGSSSDAAD